MKKQTKCRLYTRVSTAMQVDGYEETEALKRDWEKITVYRPGTVFFGHRPERILR